MVPEALRYTKTHEWARREADGRVTVGITQHAQEELKDIVFVELPKVGRALTAGEPCAVVESVKAAFDIYAPVSGQVVQINEELVKTPQLINQDCYGTGHFFTLQPAQPGDWDALMSAAAYQQLLTAGGA